MRDTLIFAVGDADALRDAVLARYDEGPFSPTTIEGPWIRQLEIGDGYVREVGEHLDRSFLACKLADRTAEPVHGQFEGYAFEQLPAEADSREIEARSPPDGAPVHHLVFALELDKQRRLARAFEDSLERTIAAQFPIINRRRTARLDLQSIKAYGPERSDGDPPFRYDRYLSVDLQLALFAWNDDERTLIDRRKDNLVLARYNLLRPSGAIVYRGDERIIPYDEYGAEWHASMRRYLRRIKALMERDDWSGVTPTSLLDD